MSRSVKKEYTGSKRFDKTCRNHGSCPYCISNRVHKNKKKMVDDMKSENWSQNDYS